MAAGTRLGPYEIVSPIGAGGMGEVYRARDTRLGRAVAIKVLPLHLSADPERKRRFEREAKVISSLNHPHICVLLDIGHSQDTDYLVMEYLEGDTLAERLRSGPLPVDKVLSIGTEIAEALDRAHRAGIIHRDLKPGNIMLTETGAKLLDFGLAKAYEPAGSDAAVTKSFEGTLHGQVLGTRDYMSPEQVRGLALDARTDIWSLGAVLYEMASGHPPFIGTTGADVLSAILLKDPPALAKVAPEIPERLDEIARKALCKDRDERYQSIRDLAIDLKRLAQKLEVASELRRSGPSAETPTAARSTAHRAVSVVPTGRRSTDSAVGKRLRGDSLAVLPFVWSGAEAVSASDPDREYLPDGITESIINSVSQLTKLKVISRSSVFRYKGREVDPTVVARELGVRKVLTGGLRRHADRLVISVELVDGRDSKHLWGRQYERKWSGLVSAPAQIAEEISHHLSASSRQEPVRRRSYPANSDAYQSYLKGRFFWNKRTGEDIKKAIEYFHQALAKDPKYALAYVGLADSYQMLGVYSSVPLKDAYMQAKAAALAALQIDDSLAEAHASLALVKPGDWDLAGALHEFARAIELNPNYAVARQWYAEHLMCVGRETEALEEIRRALELDPLSLPINTSYGLLLYQARKYDEAIVQLHKTMHMEKNFYVAHRILRDVFLEKEMYEEAITEHEAALALATDNHDIANARASALWQAYRRGGPGEYWHKRLEHAIDDMNHPTPLPYDATDVSAFHIANIYARLGERKQAINWLQRAVEEKDYGIFYIKTNPAFDELRQTAEVKNVVRHIGVEQS